MTHERKTNFSRVKICDNCDDGFLDNPKIASDPVSSSVTQLWFMCFCVECGTRAMVNVSIEHPKMMVVPYDHTSAIVSLWTRPYRGQDS